MRDRFSLNRCTAERQATTALEALVIRVEQQSSFARERQLEANPPRLGREIAGEKQAFLSALSLAQEYQHTALGIVAIEPAEALGLDYWSSSKRAGFER